MRAYQSNTALLTGNNVTGFIIKDNCLAEQDLKCVAGILERLENIAAYIEF